MCTHYEESGVGVLVVCVYICRDQRVNFGCLPPFLSTLFWELVSLLKLELDISAPIGWPESPKARPGSVPTIGFPLPSVLPSHPEGLELQTQAATAATFHVRGVAPDSCLPSKCSIPGKGFLMPEKNGAGRQSWGESEQTPLSLT